MIDKWDDKEKITDDFLEWYRNRIDAAREKGKMLFNKLIELDIFKKMPGDTIHLSDGFREYYNKILWAKIVKDFKADPLEGIDHELLKPGMLKTMI